MKVGIVGYGAFTKLMVQHIGKDFDVYVYSRRHAPEHADGGLFQFASVEDTLSADIIILSIPAQFFEEFITTNLARFNPDALVVDVASIKQAPVEVMSRLLPKSTKILGTHPLFGPGSAKNGLKDLQIVLCPVQNIDESIMELVKSYLIGKGLVVLERTAKEHDDGMAYVLGLPHIIGRAVSQMNIPNLEMTTPAYEDLIDMRDIQGGDTWDLFVSVEGTPQARQVLNEFKASIDAICAKLAKEEII